MTPPAVTAALLGVATVAAIAIIWHGYQAPGRWWDRNARVNFTIAILILALMLWTAIYP